MDGFFFTGREGAEPWQQQRLIRSRQRVFEIMEGSSPFQLADRGEARAETGLSGQPVFLWAATSTPTKIH